MGWLILFSAYIIFSVAWYLIRLAAVLSWSAIKLAFYLILEIPTLVSLFWGISRCSCQLLQVVVQPKLLLCYELTLFLVKNSIKAVGLAGVYCYAVIVTLPALVAWLGLNCWRLLVLLPYIVWQIHKWDNILANNYFEEPDRQAAMAMLVEMRSTVRYLPRRAWFELQTMFGVEELEVYCD